jgi:hypothetical protein
MKTFLVLGLVALLAACGSSTDNTPTRYNFAVIDGKNQASPAGSATLARPITSQLTRDPQGQFASRVLDFLAPEKAYAQGINLAGTPVADAIVCGRVAPVGEPQVVPLCAFTLADGKAANVVQPGTKAGTYNVVFSAQVPAAEPVVDSTTVIVQAGPASLTFRTPGTLNPSPYTLPDNTVQDQYGNGVTGYSVIGDDIISVGVDGRTLTFSKLSDAYRFLDIQDANKVLIGYLRYRIGTDSRLEWVSYGLNAAP